MLRRLHVPTGASDASGRSVHALARVGAANCAISSFVRFGAANSAISRFVFGCLVDSVRAVGVR
jgi:hypothetical protein